MPRRVDSKSELVFRAAKPRAQPYLLADGNGLALRVRPNGTRTWLLRYRRPGTSKENFLSLGPYPDVSLVDARKAATIARNLVRDGTDPVEHRRAESAARKRAAEGAFQLVAQKWLAFKRKEWADETYRKAEFVVREYLSPALGNKPISTLATPEVKPVLEAIAAHAPNLATKARQYVGGIVTYAIQHGLREDGIPLSLRGVIPRHKKGHIPAITKPAEIAPLVQAINTYKSPITRAALKLTMLTGLRPGMVAAAPWDEVDLDVAEWHVPAGRMKMQHEHIVPLPKQAVELLEELEALTGRGHYVFPSPARQKTPHLHRDALSKALRELGFQGKHATHGFRGMLRTVGRERLGIDIDILEAQLAHAKRGDVQKAYDRTTFDDDRRRVMQEWADYIDRLCSAKP
ncbi:MULTISPECIES: tyrosine-type recombinase/integrase [unclassified Paraburkholderia]|uniref:tyrosine-type recombinase/integrase n=1 Tax=unclassified Paraburkholderia TaxID=2615204 RepID=UPI0016075DFC|nr:MULTISPECIES: integrase arm-type DNA-binding domain-containing protein [unclassified Paraburkholderia]MBB5413731.1 integrase [Paraburkholderia sp. HC6.4b]MBB5456038.1 integrase [Paraburkholderia sp. Kb1A]